MAEPTTLERLRILDAIASTGTIAGAARSLGYTASAVSQHLATLEREAATALVERSNRGVVLTSAGRLLAQRAGDILDLVRNAFDEVDVASSRHETQLVVAAFPTAITEMVLPIRDQLAPSIRLTIVDAESEHALRAVTSREADAAIIDGYAHQLHHRPADLERQLLRSEAIQLVTRPGRTARSFEEYAEADWVVAGPGSPIGHAFRQLCHGAGFVPKVIAETDDHRVTFDIIRTCDAVSLLPELALIGLPDDLAIADDVDVPLRRRIEFVTRRSLSANPAIVEFAHQLSGRFANA